MTTQSRYPLHPPHPVNYAVVLALPHQPLHFRLGLRNFGLVGQHFDFEAVLGTAAGSCYDSRSRNSSSLMPACFRIVLSIPGSRGPGWSATTVAQRVTG